MMKSLLLLLVPCLLFAGCSDNIAEDQRIEPFAAKSLRNILVVDYTGQACINCPEAAQQIHHFQQSNLGSHIIPVAIHGGLVFSKTNNPKYRLDNEASRALYAKAHIEGQPTISINLEKGYLNDAWKNAAIVALQQNIPLHIDVTPTPGENAQTFQARVSLHATQTWPKASLHLWLTEDSVTAPQVMKNGKYNNKYNHMHVFRAWASSIDGEDIAIKENQNIDKTYTLTLDPLWKPKHIQLVAFVTDPTGKVLQVAQQALIPTLKP